MTTFAELDVIAPVQRALAEEKYETPTPIQAEAIPAVLAGRDMLGCAQTGTGKTAAFAVPILDRLGRRNRKSVPKRPFVLVLAPTRELAIQIGESFDVYGRHLRLRCALVYGGVNQRDQVRALNRGAHILVATPGRLLDLMNQGHIDLDQLEVFVLDEADRMLDMGFLPDLKRIISKLPQRRQSLFFSATMPPNIVKLSQHLLRDPVSIDISPESRSVEKIEQRVMFIERKGKSALLERTLKAPDVDRALVFTRTKRGANVLARQLLRSGIRAAAIHGNKSQNARQRALDAFRQRHVQVLVATDVAARGIDIDGVSHVVNFDLPRDPESYVHRIGRTGRAGAEGTALSFCSSAERGELRAIEQLIGRKVPIGKVEPLPESQRTPPRRRAAAHPAALRDSGPDGPSEPGASVTRGTGGKPQRKRTRRRGGSRRPRAKQAVSASGN